MTPETLVFLAASLLLWLSSLGYLFALEAVARRRRPKAARPASPLPAIDAVIPTWNEAATIGAKLEDLRRSDYPADLLRVHDVDRGSRDGTADVVRAAAARDGRVAILEAPEAGSKAGQLAAALPRLDREVVVFTDADSALAPDCLRAIAGTFAADPRVALVGARVRPASPLREERLHWALLNRVWELEGEALGCAGFSGVCYAARRETLRAMDGGVLAEDIHLGLRLCAAGYASRISRGAVATEYRVPRTAVEFIRFRRRRGACYLKELRFFAGRRPAGPAGWRLARFMRHWQIRATPWLGAAAALSGAALLGGGRWPLPLAAALLFYLPAAVYASGLARRSGETAAWSVGSVTLVRYLVLMLASLLALKILPGELSPKGGGAGGLARKAPAEASDP